MFCIYVNMFNSSHQSADLCQSTWGGGGGGAGVNDKKLKKTLKFKILLIIN